MKSFIAASIAAASIVNGADIFQFLKDEELGERPLYHDIKVSGFGNTVEHSIYGNDTTETFIKAPTVPFTVDVSTQVQHMEKMAEYHRNLNKGMMATPQYTCANHNPFGDDPTAAGMLLPAFGGLVNEANPSVTFEGVCFG